MGAIFDYVTYDGSLSRKEVSLAFRQDSDDDQYENGHSYSGSIGMLEVIDFYVNKTFESLNSASDYIADNHEKFNGAMATKYNDGKGGTRWIVGGWCSS